MPSEGHNTVAIPRRRPQQAHRDGVGRVDVGGGGVVHERGVLAQAQHLAEEGDGLLAQDLRGSGRQSFHGVEGKK